MIFEHLGRGRRCTANSQFFRTTISLLLSSLVLALLAGCTLQVSCHLTPTGPSQDQKEIIPNTPYELENLHEQHDSGPSWLDIVKARGFIGESYTSLTRDNNPIYIYHLINPLANQSTLNKYPVFIFHGLFMDAAHMISHSENARPRKPVIGKIISEPSDTSLAFMLSNNNFDVWMADARGSNLNNHLVNDDLNFIQGNKYWNFSLDELAQYDVTSVIDFVLEQTHVDKLHYVGFSQSTFTIFALMSSQIDYQSKLASVTALAPVAYVEHAKGLAVAPIIPSMLVPDYINGNFMPPSLTALRQLCQFHLFTRTICPFVLSSISGKGDNELSSSFYSTAFKSTSIKVIKHFYQIYLQRRFGMYDYGKDGNLRAYGTQTPPSYRLQNIKLPSISLFRGGEDLLSTPRDQHRLLRELGTKPYLDINYPGYNHLDFVVCRNIVHEINTPAATAMLHWTQVHERTDGNSTVKNPSRVSLPKRVAPVAVVKPDGSRQLKVKSNFVNNLINGLLEGLSHKISDNDGGVLTALPLLKDLWKNPLSEMYS